VLRTVLIDDARSSKDVIFVQDAFPQCMENITEEMRMSAGGRTWRIVEHSSRGSVNMRGGRIRINSDKVL
jgi:hypothetical protein